jgi:CheY-like chemotaxis protein
MADKYKILVIEDNPKDLDDVTRLLIERGDLVEAIYFSNLGDALNELDQREGERDYHGILSDALFPEREGFSEAPCGIQVIDYAMDNQIPFTIVTSLYHHDEKVDPVCNRSRLSGMELVDNNGADWRKEAVTKRWGDGLAMLVSLIDMKQKGTLHFRPIRDFMPYKKYTGMVSDDGEAIKFSFPPHQENPYFDLVKRRLRL